MPPARTRRGRASNLQSDAEVLETLPSTVASVFSQVQHSVAVHRKHQVALCAVHERCAEIIGRRSDGSPRLVGEKLFIEGFLASLNRVLGIKRGESVAERCIKFAASYTAYAHDAFRPTDVGDDYDETPAERFSEKLLKHLLRGFGAKDKNVRLRCVELVALLVVNLGAIDDEMFVLLKALLKERIFDKEAPVRMQAVIALAALQGPAEEAGEDAEAIEIRKALIWLLRHDPSAEVRRVAMLNLARTRENMPYILERMRDVDMQTRRTFFNYLLSNLPPEAWSGVSSKAPVPGSLVFEGSLTNGVIFDGLKDREPSVQLGTKRLLLTWIAQGQNDLVNFLNHFDLLAVEEPEENEDEEHEMTQPDPLKSGLMIAEQALRAVFEMQPSLTERVALVGQEADQSDTVWANLTPATALMAKAALEHWRAHNFLSQFENGMPAVTALAFRIQKHFNDMLDAADQVALAEQEGVDDAALESKRRIKASQEAVVNVLMQIVLMADFGDEIGRRKVFGLVTEMMTGDKALTLSESILADCLDLLAKLADSQADLIRIVIELTQQLEEEEDEEDEAEVENDLSLAPRQDQAHDQSPSQRQQRGMQPSQAVDAHTLRTRTICRLVMVRLMLERVGGRQSIRVLGGPMQGLVSSLIVPAVRSKELLLRWHGLRVMGLCCLLDQTLALDMFNLYLSQVRQEGSDAHRECAASVIFDMILTHGLSYLASRYVKATSDAATATATLREAYRDLFDILKLLLEDDSMRVQATAALGIGKLMLAGVLDVDQALVQEALRSMVIVYMSPDTLENIDMRQCLSYFLPAYCFSSRSNQRALHRGWMEILRDLTEVYQQDEPDPDAPPMLTPQQIAMQLIDWMDASKAVYPGEKDEALNLDVLSDIMREVLVDSLNERKLYLSLLSKVQLPDQPADESVYAVLVWADLIASPVAWQVALNQDQARPASVFDTAAQTNAFARVHTSLRKKYEDLAETLHYGRVLLSEEGAIPPAYAALRELLSQTGADAEAVIAALESSQNANAPPARATRTKRPAEAGTLEPRVPSSRSVASGRIASASSTARTVSSASSHRYHEDEEEDEAEEQGDEEEEEAERQVSSFQSAPKPARPRAPPPAAEEDSFDDLL